MMMMIFLLNILAYLMDMLCSYKTNLLSVLPVEISRLSIIVQINIGFLEGVTSDSYASVISHFLAL